MNPLRWLTTDPHRHLYLCVVSCLIPELAQAGAPLLRVTQETPIRVDWSVDGRIFLQSPQEGLWSVACGWTDGWPSGWIHASPSKVEEVNGWTLLSGTMDLPGGTMELRDAYRIENGIVRGVRRFQWNGKQDLPQVTLSVRWLVPGAFKAKPLFPGIVYYGNPAGQKTGSHAVAVHSGQPGDETFFEEHRFSAPWVSIEWADDAVFHSVAMHTVPSLAPGGNRNDQWWSLGVAGHERDTELATLSGPCAANRRHSVTKALQGSLMDYPDTWITMCPGMIIEKEFYLEVFPEVAQGSGFRQPLRTAMRLHPLTCADGLPSYDSIIRDKYAFALSRFRDREKDPGFEEYPDYIAGTQYVMGWCGQADAAGYAMLGLSKRLGDPGMVEKGSRSLNLLSQSPFNENGFHLIYTAEDGTWKGQDPVSAGQAMECFARAIRAGREIKGVDTKPWEAFLQQACTFHAQRILRDDWKPVNTAEAFFVSPLCKGYLLFGDEICKQAALKAGEYYAQRHLTMEEPYWGGTLDARCEDKEGAWAGFQAFLALYEMTHDQKYLSWAEHAMDVTLTYTVLWDIDLPPGRLHDHALKTRGWTIVSAQNQHLDVYGVLYTPELWRMGDYLNRPDLKHLAAVMYRTCGQMIDPFGSQGEQVQHTNFSQRGEMSDLARLRGGYSEDWTVFWITAHFLNAAAEFERMGVDLDRD